MTIVEKLVADWIADCIVNSSVLTIKENIQHGNHNLKPFYFGNFWLIISM